MPQGWLRLTTQAGPVCVNFYNVSDVAPVAGGGASIAVCGRAETIEVDEDAMAIMALLANRQVLDV
ncbi:hypothetical protein UFOVP747_12 [uncultured Caudovirales phage]|uniref:Uncharacterized protein n=1 Tax=uncultured Caudovirales phage TaxID=2100421 RepID=A0A6J7XC29_9CAUD|nr:hypothetical protein UFOVP675_18 [uncultured Caudovirales phage]CAB5225321.1 hypothetical protein UFOVP747_12 [uncultured Caudovirales phage]